ncbi:MAG: hypothetical protein JWQ27_2410 [Ferruginibacter sp.]|nr:hypothetical protein [Ferruginibacter sp.]
MPTPRCVINAPKYFFSRVPEEITPLAHSMIKNKLKSIAKLRTSEDLRTDFSAL